MASENAKLGKILFSKQNITSLCEEFYIGFRVTQYETGLLLELG